MKRSLTILDANLGKLLRRCYVPAFPDPAFRTRLRDVLLAAQARRFGGGTRRPRLLRRPRTWLAAAAGLMALLFVGYRIAGGPDPAAGLRGFLDEGRVAVRRAPETEWEGLAEEVASLEVTAKWLEVATPPERGLALRLADGEVTAAPDSRMVVEDRYDLWVVDLAAGGVQLHQGAPDGLWLVDTAQGSLELGPGHLAVRDDGETVHLRLDEGEAQVEVATGLASLPVGREVQLVGGRLLDPGAPPDDAPPSAPTNERTAVEPAEGPPPGDGAAEPGVVIRGRVLVAGEEEPVPEFTVAVLQERRGNEYFQPDLHGIESEDGTFELRGLRPQRARVFVHAVGHALWRSEVVALAEGSPLELEVRLGHGGEVRGVLLDPAAGTPVAGAHVISDLDTVSVGVPFDLARFPVWLPVVGRTEADGSFVLSHLSAGEHVLRFTAPGFAPLWSDPVTVEEGSRVVLDPTPLQPGGAAAGTVTAADGTPAAGRRLIITRLSVPAGERDFGMAVTDTSGRFRVEDLPPGQLLAILLLDEDGSEPPIVRPFPSTAGTTAPLDFQLAPLGTRVHGVLTDGTGNTVADRNLALVPEEERLEATAGGFLATASDADGAFAFEGVEPGRYVLLAVLDATGDELQLIDHLEVDDVPEVRCDVRLAPGRIEGRITAFIDGKPPGACIVTLLSVPGDHGFAGQVRTDEDGRYAFRYVPEGRYRVVGTPLVPGLGFEASEELLLDSLAPTIRCDLALPAGGSVRVLARDEAGAALESVVLSFQLADGTPFAPDAYYTTDPEGAFVLPGLRPGDYRVQGRISGRRDATADFTCRVGWETAVTLTLDSDR